MGPYHTIIKNTAAARTSTSLGAVTNIVPGGQPASRCDSVNPPRSEAEAADAEGKDDSIHHLR